MKRFVAILVCLILLGSIALTATAAGTAHMSISASSTTVHRGDEFTLSVNLSNDEELSAGGVVLNYDSSIFDLVGGTCHVSNTATSDVGNDSSCTFALNSDAKVSGTIFTVTLRVKSDAAFGTYSISGRPSLANAAGSISCGISGTSVTVECQHNFATYSKVDNDKHESTCTICGKTVKESHTWDDGKVTKEATCKDEGTKEFKCTACSAKKTEKVPVNEDHKYGDWTSLGYDGHTRTCTVCGNENTDEHDWYAGEILEEATCQSTGLMSVYCGDCGATAQETIPVADHNYVSTNMTAAQHTLKCSDCGTVTTGEHDFSDEWEHDKQTHYHSCEDCGYKADLAQHEPGPRATETTDQICTVCERILQPKGDHVHEFQEEWGMDEENHWRECIDCPEREKEGPHAYDNDCDAECNDCGFTRSVTHQLSLTFSSDATGHWYACQLCDSKEHFAEHTPGPEASISAAQTCTTCQFEIAPAIAHDHVYNAEGAIHYHKCACGDELQAEAGNCDICDELGPQFPWLLICILEALIFAAVIVLILLKKQIGSSNTDEDADEEADETEEE